MSLAPSSPRVAVVVPLFNRAHCILATLDSILAQTLRPAQLIVVDNASTDDSKAVVATWMQQQKPHCELLLLSEDTPGAAAARNRGLQAVTTEWVSFFDSDDWMSPDFLEQMMRAALAQQREWVIARTRMVFPSSTPAVPVRQVVRWGTPAPTLVDQILGACIATQSFVAQTDLLRRIGGWNSALSLWDDYELGLRLLLASPHPAWCEGVFHQIVQHPDSITGGSYCSRAKQINSALLSLVQILCDSSINLSGAQQQEALRALHYRTHIVAGQLIQEGAPQAAQELLATMHYAMPNPKEITALFATLLRRYVSWGGKGAWRVARLLARC